MYSAAACVVRVPMSILPTLLCYVYLCRVTTGTLFILEYQFDIVEHPVERHYKYQFDIVEHPVERH